MNLLQRFQMLQLQRKKDPLIEVGRYNIFNELWKNNVLFWNAINSSRY